MNAALRASITTPSTAEHRRRMTQKGARFLLTLAAASAQAPYEPMPQKSIVRRSRF